MSAGAAGLSPPHSSNWGLFEAADPMLPYPIPKYVSTELGARYIATNWGVKGTGRPLKPPSALSTPRSSTTEPRTSLTALPEMSSDNSATPLDGKSKRPFLGRIGSKFSEVKSRTRARLTRSSRSSTGVEADIDTARSSYEYQPQAEQEQGQVRRRYRESYLPTRPPPAPPQRNPIERLEDQLEWFERLLQEQKARTEPQRDDDSPSSVYSDGPRESALEPWPGYRAARTDQYNVGSQSSFGTAIRTDGAIHLSDGWITPIHLGPYPPPGSPGPFPLSAFESSRPLAVAGYPPPPVPRSPPPVAETSATEPVNVWVNPKNWDHLKPLDAIGAYPTKKARRTSPIRLPPVQQPPETPETLEIAAPTTFSIPPPPETPAPTTPLLQPPTATPVRTPSSVYRPTAIEEWRRTQGWTPSQLIEHYCAGWEPGSTTSVRAPIDLLAQAMLDTDTTGYDSLPGVKSGDISGRGSRQRLEHVSLESIEERVNDPVLNRQLHLMKRQRDSPPTMPSQETLRRIEVEVGAESSREEKPAGQSNSWPVSQRLGGARGKRKRMHGMSVLGDTTRDESYPPRGGSLDVSGPKDRLFGTDFGNLRSGPPRTPGAHNNPPMMVPVTIIDPESAQAEIAGSPGSTAAVRVDSMQSRFSQDSDMSNIMHVIQARRRASGWWDPDVTVFSAIPEYEMRPPNYQECGAACGGWI